MILRWKGWFIVNALHFIAAPLDLFVRWKHLLISTSKSTLSGTHEVIITMEMLLIFERAES